MTASITVSDIQDVYGEKTPSLSSSKQTALKDIAENITNNNFGGRVARQTEIEGDEDDFAKYMGAHLWQLAEGQTLNEEFQTGNTDIRQTIVSDPSSSLSQTVYGQTCLLMLRDRASISMVRSDI